MLRSSFLAVLSFLAIAHANPLGLQSVFQKDGQLQTTANWKWTDCGLPTDIIQVESIEVSPDPPKPGEDLTVTVIGTATEVIEEGAYADVTVKLGLIKILTKTFDVCEEARNANASIQCPVSEGKHTVVQTVALPKEIPKAKFTVNVKGYTVDDDDMVCVDLMIDFMQKPFLKW